MYFQRSQGVYPISGTAYNYPMKMNGAHIRYDRKLEVVKTHYAITKACQIDHIQLNKFTSLKILKWF